MKAEEVKKYKRKRRKATESGIVFGTDTNYRILGYTITLRELVANYKEEGIQTLQSAYNRIKKRLKSKEKIFNKNLRKLGVKL